MSEDTILKKSRAVKHPQKSFTKMSTALLFAIYFRRTMHILLIPRKAIARLCDATAADQNLWGI